MDFSFGFLSPSFFLTLAADTNRFRAVTDIIVYTPDNAGLFSQFAGAIAMSGGSIVDAKAFTTSDGLALDVFSVQDAEGEAFGDKERVARLTQSIEKTLRGEIRPHQMLAQMTARRAQRTRASGASIGSRAVAICL